MLGAHRQMSISYTRETDNDAARQESESIASTRPAADRTPIYESLFFTSRGKPEMAMKKWDCSALTRGRKAMETQQGVASLRNQKDSRAAGLI